ncbi:MAG TPA: response regulator transcription factor [Puia sp.]|nr:response regulator transcription factor [Puia sp.]
MKITIGITDDHALFLHSLSALISSIPSFQVVLEALNGEELLTQLRRGSHPDIVLLDVGMPVLDGVRTALVLAKEYPAIKTVALSMKADDLSIISMLKAGCCAYLLKEIRPDELEKALMEIYTHGYYNADAINLNYRRIIQKSAEDWAQALSAREKEFLRHACSDLTYKEIATLMFVAERTIDGYRDALFQKMGVKSRVGMVLEALRHDLVSL